MKTSQYKEWIGKLPLGSWLLLAYEKRNYKVDATVFVTTGGSGEVTDYFYDILETPDGVNKIFTLRFDYAANSCRVYLNGVRQTPGYDYNELGSNKIEFIEAPESIPAPHDVRITVDYIKTDE